MKKKNDRLEAIREIVGSVHIGSQDELLKELESRGFKLTQATLSRDLKQMQVAKVANSEGGYMYVIPEKMIPKKRDHRAHAHAALSIEFSGQMAVIKTRPSHASSIAYEIDMQAIPDILGTIAGDDTVLLILREGVSRSAVLSTLSLFIQGF